jgi:hypothetical protein
MNGAHSLLGEQRLKSVSGPPAKGRFLECVPQSVIDEVLAKTSPIFA